MRRSLLDLAGNLTEWAEDWIRQQDEEPWSSQLLLRDPVAVEAGVLGALRAVRGSSWRSDFLPLRAASRTGRDPTVENRSICFRCARRDRG